MSEKISVALIGAGAMGGALLRGWLADGVIDPARSAVFDPAPNDQIRDLAGARGIALNPPLSGARYDALVLAIKPKLAADALPGFATLAAKALVISVMAGKTIASIKKSLGASACVARVMPNLPAAIGKGVTGLYAPADIDADGRDKIERLMAAAGETVWVDREAAIDYVTAVSGSGPAYFLLMVEALAEAGKRLGLPPDTASRLARATLHGTGALIAVDSRDAGEIRRAVTSPGGTTAAALKVLDGDAHTLHELMEKAVAAAAQRAVELSD